MPRRGAGGWFNSSNFMMLKIEECVYLGLVQVWYVSQHPSSLILRQKLISFGWNCPRYIGGSVQQMQFGHLCNDWGRFCDIDGPGWAKTVISPQLSTIHIFHTKLIMDINPSRTQHLETLNHLLLGMGTHNFKPYLFKSCFLVGLHDYSRATSLNQRWLLH